jgi:hypothetical protein
MIYNNFIYYTDQNKDLLKQFYSYKISDEEEFLSNFESENYITYLDFDRIIRVPDSVNDENLQNWLLDNWKTASQGFHFVFEDNGIFFRTEGSSASYLVKRMSEIIKEKIKLFYFCFEESLCGEYLAYPDKDGIDIVYKPMSSAPEPVLTELSDKADIIGRNGLDVKQIT